MDITRTAQYANIVSAVIAAIAVVPTVMSFYRGWSMTTRRLLSALFCFSIGLAIGTSLVPHTSAPDDKLRAAQTLLAEQEQELGKTKQELVTLRHEFEVVQSETSKRIAELGKALDETRSLAEERGNEVDKLKQRIATSEEVLTVPKGNSAHSDATMPAATAPVDSTPVSKATHLYTQNTKWFKASIKKFIVQPSGDVVAFFEYSSRLTDEYDVGLSGCANDWREKTYAVDNVGNIFRTSVASGIGYIGCDFINDPVLLTSGGTATFSIVFARPQSFDKRGSTYSISSAQCVGRVGADGHWREVSDVNISLTDIEPDK